MPTQKFDFETYVINTLDSLNKKLDGLNTTYMPREETNLRFSEILKTQATTIQTIAEHTKMITALKSTDDRQQGAIDAGRRTVNTALTIAGLLGTGLFIYVSWKVGVAK
jgi:hypothetical protein